MVASVLDTAETFLKHLGPDPGGNDVELQGFWYTVGGGSSSVIFDLSSCTGYENWFYQGG